MSEYTFYILLALIGIILVISVYGISTVYGETEQECTKFRSNEMIKLEVRDSRNIGGCDWLVGVILSNGSEFNIKDYNLMWTNGASITIETWVLTK